MSQRPADRQKDRPPPVERSSRWPATSAGHARHRGGHHKHYMRHITMLANIKPFIGHGEHSPCIGERAVEVERRKPVRVQTHAEGDFPAWGRIWWRVPGAGAISVGRWHDPGGDAIPPQPRWPARTHDLGAVPLSDRWHASVSSGTLARSLGVRSCSVDRDTFQTTGCTGGRGEKRSDLLTEDRNLRAFMCRTSCRA